VVLVGFALAARAPRSPAEALVVAAVGASFLLVALGSRGRQGPERDTSLLALVGGLWLLGAPTADEPPALFIVGWLASPLAYAALAYLLVAFHSSTALDGLGRAAVILAFAAAGPVQLAATLVTNTDAGPCPCQTNPLMLADIPAASDTLLAIQAALAFLAAVMLALALGRRVASATRGERRAIAPLLAGGLMTIAALVTAVILDRAGVPLQEGGVLRTARFAALGLVPGALLTGIVLERADRSARLERLLDALGRAPATAAELEPVLRDACDDPALRLAFREDNRWVDTEGRDVAVAGDAWTVIEEAGRPLAGIRSGSGSDRGLLTVISAAILVTRRQERLLERLEAQNRDLFASRRRLVEAADSERRRIERNLHDGAQQQLLGIGIRMRLALDQLPDQPRRAAELIGEADAALDDVTRDLRALARGLVPPLLAERGLVAALDALITAAPVPAELTHDLPGPLPPALESTAYFLVAESLTNVVRHACARRSTVRVAADDGRLLVEVGDDGRGGAIAAAGSGLAGLADRVAAVGGVFAVASPTDGGTRVTATLPLPHAKL
jgi:signal transduction histidine kinase